LLALFRFHSIGLRFRFVLKLV